MMVYVTIHDGLGHIINRLILLLQILRSSDDQFMF